MTSNILKEIVQYTTSVDLDLVKITGNDQNTVLEAITSDKTMVLKATFKNQIAEFVGTAASPKIAGLPNLGRLNVILNIPEYRENVQIATTNRNSGEPETIVFNNDQGDFTNIYRLMASTVANSLVPSVSLKATASWNLDFEPLAQNIQKFRYQVQANSDSVNFQTFTKNGNLYFELGEVSSHQGNFVFHQAKGNLADKMSWPVKQVLGILNLPGDKRMRISDVGVMQITVDSGVADYEYLIPAVSK